MIRNTLILLLSLFAAVNTTMAQPSPVKKAAKSMFKLTTFDTEGNILNTGYGVFVGADGSCLGSWEPFVGASSANVIDVLGRKYDVDCLIGANEIYNVAKFRVSVPENKKMAIAPVPVASAQIAAGTQCWFAEYAIKNPVLTSYKPANVETFAESLPYYIFEQTAEDKSAGSPFFNEAGELLGLMQPAKTRTDIYCPSAQYAMAMTVKGLTANEPTLRRSLLRVAVPTEYSQAQLALMMASSRFSSPVYLSTANEFISFFPTQNDGYIAKADYLLAQNDVTGAEAAMKECVEKTEQKDDAHFSYSKLIYNKVLNNTDSTFTAWTYDNALTEIDAALAANPLPMYSMQKARTLMAMKNYDEAYREFFALRTTNMRSGEAFYLASLCRQQLNANNDEITTLLDSAVACYQKPYRSDAAPYLLIRANWLDKLGKSRLALADYNDYDTIMHKSLNANFYYTREQVALRARQYKQALEDIDQAILLNPQEGTYQAEKALLLLRVNHIDDAIKTAERAERFFPTYGDPFAIHGAALCIQGKKKEGIALFEKAKALESPLAEQLMEKYK